jgi:hypothetical protein
MAELINTLIDGGYTFATVPFENLGAITNSTVE